MSVRRTLARNTAFNALGRLWEALAGIVLTAYIVERLGIGPFGLWSLVAAFTGYAALLDFGVSSAFTKYIAQHAAHGDAKAVSAVVSTGAAFYAALGILIVALGWPLVDLLIAGITRLLVLMHPDGTPAYENARTIGDVRFLFRGSLILFAITNCIAPFSALQSGLQRMGITNVLSFGASLLKFAATIGFVECGYGVRGLLYANAVVLAAFALACVAVAYRIFPGLRLGTRQVKRSTLSVLMSFGWRMQVAKLSNLINFQTDRAIVGLVFGNFALVGLYRLGEELAGKMRQLPALVVSALIPAVSDLDARNQQEQLSRLYLLSTKYIAAVTIPLAGYFAASADLLMRAWFGDTEGLEAAAWVMRIIAAGYAANLLPGPGVSIALGKGRAGLPMTAGIISMACNIAFTIALVMAVGFYGVPVATALAFLVSTVWFFRAMRQTVDVPLRRLLWTSVAWPALASVPGFAACLATGWLMADYAGRLPNLVAAAGCAACFGLTYIAVGRMTPFLDTFDVDFLEHTLHLGRLPGFELLTRRARHA